MRRLVVGAALSWARSAHQRSLANARLGATECSRRRLERVEVETFLERLGQPIVSAGSSVSTRSTAPTSAHVPVALAVH